MALLPLSPHLKSYAWGDTESIPRLLGRAPTGEPVAEAWYGAHPSAPALVEGRGLDAVIAEDPELWLGPEIATASKELPYLLKLLAAARPLSIQVHPNQQQAEAGYARETRAGTASADRRYKDARHKPELMVALTPFEGLCGFLPPELRTRNLGDSGLAEAWPELPDPGSDVQSFLRDYFALPAERREAGLAGWLQRSRAGPDLGPEDPGYWALRAQAELGLDRPDAGLVFTLLLERVHLEPGEGLFLPAGVPHAYLQGAGVEIMASSDNVLRAGLTSKPVDPSELLRVVRFDALGPSVGRPVPCDGEALHLTPTSDFELGLREGTGGDVWSRRAHGPETLLVLEGEVRVEDANGPSLRLTRGGACLVAHDTPYRVVFETDARVIRARVPAPQAEPRFRGRRPTPLRFGTSGLRGRVDDITDLEAYVNARGFLEACIERGAAVPGTRVDMGSDRRPSTPRIAAAVARAARDLGLHPVSAGVLPTPALTLQGIESGCPSIMVTGSHIPFDRNGIKFNFPTGEVSKADEAPILEAVARVRQRAYGTAAEASPFDDAGRLRAPEPATPEDGAAQGRYVRRYVEAFQGLDGVRIAFWAHSAAGRTLLPQVLERLGAQVHVVGASEDFVALDTEAIDAESLRAMQTLHDELVASKGPVDLFVSTDGDSDRPLVCAIKEGKLVFVPGDVLGCLVAQGLDADHAVVPVSANDGIDQVFSGRVTRTRIGSPWVIAGMEAARGERVVGWEANGGFLTRDPLSPPKGRLAPLPTRDALLPIVCAARECQTRPLWAAVEALPPRHGASGLRDGVPPAQSRALLALLQETPEHAEVIGLGPVKAIDLTDGVRMRFSGDEVAHVRPSGNAPQLRVYAQADSPEAAQRIVETAFASGGWLDRLLARAEEARFVGTIRRNIEHAERLFTDGGGPQVMGTVAGTEAARRFWARELQSAKTSLGLRLAVSQHEDLPVNQAFGLLLMWKRLRPLLGPDERALFAFVFGEGSRIAPLGEAECGQKPALSSFVRRDGRWLSTVELALRTFAPVEAHLHRSGFRGVVVKWGDEVQIPTRDLSTRDPLFDGADVVRFVSMQPMSEDTARNKDWVGVDAEGEITAFIPRRPLTEMAPLADRGLLQRRNGSLWGGINLGSIAFSRALLDVLLEAFEAEIEDPTADRRLRPDLDPQLFTALTLAVRDPRPEAWRAAVGESAALAKLDANMPGLFRRLVDCVERFREVHGRPPRLVAMDFGEQYWGDVGQHPQMREVFMALRERSPVGTIARALAGLPDAFDAQGNLISEDSELGAIQARDSVLLGVQLTEGRVEGSVLVGSRCRHIECEDGFDVRSVGDELRIEAGGGAYRVVSESPVHVPPEERATTLFLPEGLTLMRVQEGTDLRDRQRNYEQPIAGNPMSFAEARSRVLKEDPETWAARRARAEAEVSWGSKS